MKRILLILIFLNFLNSNSQSNQEIDSLSLEMCELLKIQKVKNDSIKVENVFDQSFYPYLGNIDPEIIDNVFNKVYFRFQRNCPEFRAILNKMYPPQDGVSFQKTEPKSKITFEELKEFKKLKKFTYKEVDGKTTKVEISDEYWIDNFSDDTYSKLTFEWISDKKFQLTFIESDNLTRSNFSFPGDKLIYKVLEKKQDHYLLSVNIEGQEDYEIFKLYFS